MQQMRDIQQINRAQAEDEDDDYDDESFSAPMIDASYLRGSSNNNGGPLTQSGASQYQNEPLIKDAQSPQDNRHGSERCIDLPASRQFAAANANSNGSS